MYATLPPVVLVQYAPSPRDTRVEKAPNGDIIVYDRNGRRVGTVQQQPNGQPVYRDFQSGQRRF